MWTERQGQGMVELLDKLSPETGPDQSIYNQIDDIITLLFNSTP